MMKMTLRKTIVLAASAAFAFSALALPSPEKRAWADGPVQYIMTKDELAKWRQLETDADADAFVALFWARRDPTPDTPRNEFREEFEARVKFVDEQFKTAKEKGSATERGRIFIVFGQPTKAVNVAADVTPSAPSVRKDGPDQSAHQIWTYEGPGAQKAFGIPHAEVRFIDRFNSGSWSLDPAKVDVAAAAQKVILANITQPQLTKAPVFEAPKPVQAAAPPAGIHTPALQKAIDDAKAKPAATSPAQVSYAEFLDSLGDYFVPVALTVPTSANILLGTESPVIFGELVGADGKTVSAFEEKATPVNTKTGWFVGHSFEVPTGKYTAYIGVARAGEPLLVASGPVETTTVAKDAVGTSKLILWSDAQILPDQKPNKWPFAFGNLLVVPNPSMTFTNQDELGYFLELNNPGVDAETLKPKLQMSLELQANGQPISRQPLTEAQFLPLGEKAVAHYVIVNSIPLSKMSKPLAPGNYTLKMKVVDTVTKQSYTVQENFKITG